MADIQIKPICGPWLMVFCGNREKINLSLVFNIGVTFQSNLILLGVLLEHCLFFFFFFFFSFFLLCLLSAYASWLMCICKSFSFILNKKDIEGKCMEVFVL